MNNQKVLVTGANGLLGANIVDALNQQGYLVKVIVRKGSNLISLQGLKYEIYFGNITEKRDLEEAIIGCNFVIHSAAMTAQSANNLSDFLDVNYNPTENLIKLCRKYKIKKFVYVSTANCFTNGTKENPGTEKSSFMPWLKKSGYAYSKYLAQKIVLEEIKNSNFKGLVVVPTFMIGQRDSKPSSGKLLLYVLKNKIVFYPPGGKSFVDVEKVAKAIVNSLEKGRIGDTYLLSGKNITYKEFYKEVISLSQEKKILLPIPKILLKTLGISFSLIQKIFRITLAFNIENQRLLCLDNYFSSKKAQKELNFGDTNLKDIISKSIKWFDNNRYLTFL